jgi:hypothetical protein
LNKSEINKINRVHSAEFTLGPDAQCGRGRSLRHQLGPRAQRVRGPRPRGRTAHDHTAGRRLTSLETVARRRRRRATGDGDGRRGRLRSERPDSDSGGRDCGCQGGGAWSEAVGKRAGAARRAVGDDAECGAWSGATRQKQGALSGHAPCCPDNGLKPLCQRGAWRPRGSGARRLTSGVCLSVISELKKYPEGN